MDDDPIRPPAVLAAIWSDTEKAGFALPSDYKLGGLLRVLAASKPGGRLLEIGTGTGLAAAWLLDGMDARPSHLDRGRWALGGDRRQAPARRPAPDPARRRRLLVVRRPARRQLRPRLRRRDAGQVRWLRGALASAEARRPLHHRRSDAPAGLAAGTGGARAGGAGSARRAGRCPRRPSRLVERYRDRRQDRPR